MTTIIFFAALSEYNLGLYEERAVNRMKVKRREEEEKKRRRRGREEERKRRREEKKKNSRN